MLRSCLSFVREPLASEPDGVGDMVRIGGFDAELRPARRTSVAWQDRALETQAPATREREHQLRHVAAGPRAERLPPRRRGSPRTCRESSARQVPSRAASSTRRPPPPAEWTGPRNVEAAPSPPWHRCAPTSDMRARRGLRRWNRAPRAQPHGRALAPIESGGLRRQARARGAPDRRPGRTE